MAANSEPITLAALFVHWRNLPHQRAAVAQLEEELKVGGWAKAMDRRRPWYLTWASRPAAPAPDWLAPAFQLIRSFEGCHLQAYLCPAGVPTIGWGNTRILNRPVVLSDRITRAQADRMLEDTVESQIVPTLARTVPHWREMRGHQRCALVSFAFNLGWGFYGSSGFATISAALRERRWSDVPAAMLLYRNPGSRFEEGLRRRRVAEGALWAQGPS